MEQLVVNWWDKAVKEGLQTVEVDYQEKKGNEEKLEGLSFNDEGEKIEREKSKDQSSAE